MGMHIYTFKELQLLHTAKMFDLFITAHTAVFFPPCVSFFFSFSFMRVWPCYSMCCIIIVSTITFVFDVKAESDLKTNIKYYSCCVSLGDFVFFPYLRGFFRDVKERRYF